MGLSWVQHDPLLEEQEEGYTLLVGGVESDRRILEVTVADKDDCFTVIDTQVGVFGIVHEGNEMIRITQAQKEHIKAMVFNACPLSKCFFVEGAWVRRKLRIMVMRIKIFAPGKSTIDAPIRMPGASTPEGIY